MVAEHHHLLALLSDELEIAVESGLQDGILQVRQLVADGKVNDGVGNSLTAGDVSPRRGEGEKNSRLNQTPSKPTRIR